MKPVKTFLFLLVAICVLNSCVSIKYNEWKYESGCYIGDFIDFGSGIYKIDENNYIYINNEKVAKIMEVKFGVVGNHKMIIESTFTKEKGVYTML